MPLIAPESFRVPKIPPAPVVDNKKNELERGKNIVIEKDDESDSDESDSDQDSDSVSIDLGEYVKQGNKIEENKINGFNIGKDSEKSSTRFNTVKSERENPTHFFMEEAKVNNLNSNQHVFVHSNIIERSDSVLPSQSVPGRDSANVGNVHVLFESVQMPQPLFQTAPPPVILPSIPVGNCSKCDKKIDENYIKLDCPHFFHRECFKNQYENKILKAKKVSDIACIKCSKLINIESLSNMSFLENKVKTRANILNFSTVEVSCPKCQMPLKEKMVNPKNLKPEDAKCKNCKSKICSFCSVIGGHRFFCDLFRDFSQGKSNFDQYVKPAQNK
jgi:hypothetical protein